MSQPSFGGEMRQIGREAVNDVRGTLHQAFFGSPEHPSGLGTPMSPTPQQVMDNLHPEPTQEAQLDIEPER